MQNISTPCKFLRSIKLQLNLFCCKRLVVGGFSWFGGGFAEGGGSHFFHKALYLINEDVST
jgi:hypothetical protein